MITPAAARTTAEMHHNDACLDNHARADCVAVILAEQYSLDADERKALKFAVELRIDLLKDIEQSTHSTSTAVGARRQIDALVRYATRMEL